MRGVRVSRLLASSCKMMEIKLMCYLDKTKSPVPRGNKSPQGHSGGPEEAHGALAKGGGISGQK